MAHIETMAGHVELIRERTYTQATRAIIARKLKGLEDFITVSSVHWHLGEKGRLAHTYAPRERQEGSGNVLRR